MRRKHLYQKILSKVSKLSNGYEYQCFLVGQSVKAKVSNGQNCPKSSSTGKALLWTLGHFGHFAKIEVSNPKSVGAKRKWTVWTLWTLKNAIPKTVEVRT